MGENLETLAVAAVLSTVLLLTGKFSFAKTIGRRKTLSMAAGGSLAYIFIRLLPEIHANVFLFQRSVKTALPYEGTYGVNLAMLIGFLCFYGLAEMHSTPSGAAKQKSKRVFAAYLAGYGCYIMIIGYLLVRSLAEVEEPLLPYAVAMSLHFMLVGFGLRDVHEELYDRVGRYALTAFCLAGWFAGVLVELPKPLVILLFGFVSGGVISVTGIVELPKGPEGRFVPFVAGAMGYTAFLVLCR